MAKIGSSDDRTGERGREGGKEKEKNGDKMQTIDGGVDPRLAKKRALDVGDEGEGWGGGRVRDEVEEHGAFCRVVHLCEEAYIYILCRSR